MQQQTTVLSTSGSYLSPGVAFPPCHIQQIGAVSLNGLPATPIAPTSGESSFREAPRPVPGSPPPCLTLSPPQGCTRPHCWAPPPFLAWWRPFPMASQESCPFLGATLPWRLCTPMASSPTQVTRERGRPRA